MVGYHPGSGGRNGRFFSSVWDTQMPLSNQDEMVPMIVDHIIMIYVSVSAWDRFRRAGTRIDHASVISRDWSANFFHLCHPRSPTSISAEILFTIPFLRRAERLFNIEVHLFKELFQPSANWIEQRLIVSSLRLNNWIFRYCSNSIFDWTVPRLNAYCSSWSESRKWKIGQYDAFTPSFHSTKRIGLCQLPGSEKWKSSSGNSSCSCILTRNALRFALNRWIAWTSPWAFSTSKSRMRSLVSWEYLAWSSLSSHWKLQSRSGSGRQASETSHWSTGIWVFSEKSAKVALGIVRLAGFFLKNSEGYGFFSTFQQFLWEWNM